MEELEGSDEGPRALELLRNDQPVTRSEPATFTSLL